MLRRSLALARAIFGSSTTPTPTSTPTAGPTKTPGGSKSITGTTQPTVQIPQPVQIPPSVASASILTVALSALYRVVTAPRAMTLPSATPAIKASSAIDITSPLAQEIKKHMCKTYELLNTHDSVVANNYVKNHVLSLADLQTVVEICNELLRKDKEFREFIEKCIEESMHQTSPLLKYDYISSDHKPVPVFRSVVINGNYGDPKFVLEQGFTASLFNMRPGAADVVVPASVNTFVAEEVGPEKHDAKLRIPGRYDMLGFTFGALISTSLNVFHALDERYMAQTARNKGQRVIYLLGIKKGFNTGEAIHEGTGYIRDRKRGLQGEKGTGCQEDAAEIAANPVIESHELLGYRVIEADGRIGPFVKNPQASDEMLKEFMQYADVKLFMDVKTLKQAQELEAVMVGDPSKIEGHDVKINRHRKKHRELTKRIESEARGFGRDELLHREVHGDSGAEIAAAQKCDDTREHLELFIEAHEHRKRVHHGELVSGPQRFFHSQKAKSEAELKERAISAKKKLTGETGEAHTTPKTHGKKK